MDLSTATITDFSSTRTRRGIAWTAKVQIGHATIEATNAGNGSMCSLRGDRCVIAVLSRAAASRIGDDIAPLDALLSAGDKGLTLEQCAARYLDVVGAL